MIQHPPDRHHPADDHDHHDHVATDYRGAFIGALALNVGFVAIEVVYGLMANSVALLADAGHNATDALGLVIAWTAHAVSRREPTSRFTYGLRGASILAALANSVLLLVLTGGLLWETIHRFGTAPAIDGRIVMIVAAVGVVINAVSAFWLASGREDLNIRAAFVHLLGDAAISAAVVLSGLGILLFGWRWLDPATGLVVSFAIVLGSWQVLRETVSLALHAVPNHIDLGQVEAFLGSRAGVEGVHDLHVWGMSTTETALTAHLVMPGGHPDDEFFDAVADELRGRFRIHHATVQIEVRDGGHACALAAARPAR